MIHHVPMYTALLAAAMIVLQNVLMLKIGKYRGSKRQGAGYGDDKDLERMVRGHANLAENAAIYLVTLGLYELLVGQTIMVMVLAAVFGLARLSHAYAFSSNAGSHGDGSKEELKHFLRFRFWGTALTGLCGLVLAVAIVVAVVI